MTPRRSERPPGPHHDAPAPRLIRQLEAQGWTGRALQRAIGRNSSLFSQVGRGDKPGSNLVNALQDLAAGRTRPTQPPERRLTAEGQRASTRRGVREADNRTNYRGKTSAKGVTFNRVLQKAVDRGQRVAVRVRTKRAGWKTVTPKGGRRADFVRDAGAAYGGPFGSIHALDSEAQSPTDEEDEIVEYDLSVYTEGGDLPRA